MDSVDETRRSTTGNIHTSLVNISGVSNLARTSVNRKRDIAEMPGADLCNRGKQQGIY